MKLYVYDHCPFCVRTRIPLGLKGIAAELVILANDDEVTPISMIGAKMLPILERGGEFMGESLDIVKALDEMSGAPMFDGEPDAALQGWIKAANPAIDLLVIPRTPVPIYDEFTTDEARAYFTGKKQVSFGNFEALFARTPELIREVEASLETLVPLLPKAHAAGIDDVLLFPILRGLEIVEGLRLPDEVTGYIARLSEAAAVPRVTPQREIA